MWHDDRMPLVGMLKYMVIAADPHYLPAFPLQPSQNLSAVGFHCESPA
jgi:hypothetical protein